MDTGISFEWESLIVPRPRKQGKRYRCGKLRQSMDHGTPEVILKRLHIVGPGDPSKAHYQLGILLERGQITEEQHQAGLVYAKAFRIAVCAPQIRANGALARLMPSDSREVSESLREELTGVWKRMAKALGRVKPATDNVALFDIPESRIDQVNRGLTILAESA